MSYENVKWDYPQHVVCTHDQARKHIEEHEEFYINICGCRQAKGGCKRSRMDVCLWFIPGGSTGGQKRAATKQEALDIVAHAGETGLIARPFRSPDDINKLEGICFCCPVCCYYFSEGAEPCGKGTLRESTILEDCSACGMCVKACHFGARSIVGGKLVIDAEKCYGCGLCVDACPAGCITMK
ncbi:MAG: 4Fe-4S binding protein [Bacillota bacterium]